MVIGLLNVMFAAVPSQITAVVLLIVKVGSGFTVTVVCWVVGFEHAFAATLNVYVTVNGVLPGLLYVSVIC